MLDVESSSIGPTGGEQIRVRVGRERDEGQRDTLTPKTVAADESKFRSSATFRGRASGFCGIRLERADLRFRA